MSVSAHPKRGGEAKAMGICHSLCVSNKITEEEELDVIPDEPRLLKPRRRSSHFSNSPENAQAYYAAVEMMVACQGKRFKDDYKTVKVLGAGSYSHVMVCQKRATKEVYAVKAIKKQGEDDDDRQKRTVLRELGMALAIKGVK